MVSPNLYNNMTGEIQEQYNYTNFTTFTYELNRNDFNNDYIIYGNRGTHEEIYRVIERQIERLSRNISNTSEITYSVNIVYNDLPSKKVIKEIKNDIKHKKEFRNFSNKRYNDYKLINKKMINHFQRKY